MITLTTHRTSDEAPQMRFVWQIAILAPKHAEVGRVVAKKSGGGNSRETQSA